MSEGEDLEEGESVGREMERHERHEGNKLVSVEEGPHGLE